MRDAAYLGYELRPSDLTDDVFLKKLVKRVKQWFVSYSAKSKKRTSNSYVASATEVVHQLMPTDIIEATVAAKGDAPSGQERDAANASTDLDVATATRCPKKSQAENAEAQRHADDRQANRQAS